MTLSQIIKSGMKAQGISTYEELSKVTGISIDTIKTYTSSKGDKREPNFSFLKKLSFVIDLMPYFENLSPNHQKNVSQSVSQSSKKCLPIHSSPQSSSTSDSYYVVPKLTLSAQAGGGNEILDLECYESGEVLTIDKAFFKAIPSDKLKAIKVEGYSMIPMLLPDSWVVFEEEREYRGDGLYIINYAGQLMVKLLQLDPIRKILDIVSVNKEYKSYSISLSESQLEFIIIGKVLRCII